MSTEVHAAIFNNNLGLQHNIFITKSYYTDRYGKHKKYHVRYHKDVAPVPPQPNVPGQHKLNYAQQVVGITMFYQLTTILILLYYFLCPKKFEPLVPTVLYKPSF
jgi:hypothetical protein